MALVGMLAVTSSSSALATAAPIPITQTVSGNKVQPKYVNTMNIAASLKIEGIFPRLRH